MTMKKPVRILTGFFFLSFVLLLYNLFRNHLPTDDVHKVNA